MSEQRLVSAATTERTCGVHSKTADSSALNSPSRLSRPSSQNDPTKRENLEIRPLSRSDRTSFNATCHRCPFRSFRAATAGLPSHYGP